MGAEKLFQRACARYEKDMFQERAQLLLQALDLGEHTKAAALLGTLYSQGKGVHQNLVKAVELLHLGLDGGDADAAGTLCLMYTDGLGVEIRLPALQLLEQSHSAGNRKATSILGTMYLSGSGVPKNTLRAVEYLTTALLSNVAVDADEAFFLGAMCLHGEGVEWNEKMGLMLLETSHKGDNPAASWALAEFYKQRRNFSKATPYFEAAHWGSYACGRP